MAELPLFGVGEGLELAAEIDELVDVFQFAVEVGKLFHFSADCLGIATLHGILGAEFGGEVIQGKCGHACVFCILVVGVLAGFGCGGGRFQSADNSRPHGLGKKTSGMAGFSGVDFGLAGVAVFGVQPLGCGFRRCCGLRKMCGKCCGNHPQSGTR